MSDCTQHTRWIRSDKDKGKLYFAYGSNMNIAQMKNRCPTAVSVAVGCVEGHKFLINEIGVASIDDSSEDQVLGVLWEISTEDENTLDRYEKVSSGMYTKESVTALVENKKITCLCYMATNNDDGPPRPDYLEKVIAGANDFSLPADWISFLHGFARP